MELAESSFAEVIRRLAGLQISTLPLPEGQVDILPLTLQWVDTATFSVAIPTATQTTTRRLR